MFHTLALSPHPSYHRTTFPLFLHVCFFCFSSVTLLTACFSSDNSELQQEGFLNYFLLFLCENVARKYFGVV